VKIDTQIWNVHLEGVYLKLEYLAPQQLAR
jgi:hypothetical protein